MTGTSLGLVELETQGFLKCIFTFLKIGFVINKSKLDLNVNIKEHSIKRMVWFRATTV